MLDFVIASLSLENVGYFLLRILLGIDSGLTFYKEIPNILHYKM